MHKIEFISGDIAVVSVSDGYVWDEAEWLKGILPLNVNKIKDDPASLGEYLSPFLRANVLAFAVPMDDPVLISVIDGIGFTRKSEIKTDDRAIAPVDNAIKKGDRYYYLCNISSIVHEIEAAQFIARLYLLSKGDIRHDDVLPDRSEYSPDNYALFKVNVPGHIAYVLQGYMSASINIGEVNSTDAYNSFVDVYTPIVEEDEWRIRRFTALALLEAIINSLSSNRLVASFSELRLVPDENDGKFNQLFSAIENDLVIACPHCGAPMLLKHKSSKPFCKHSHQIRYHESAKSMLFNDGASVDEVCERFPFINPKTIAHWHESK